MNLIIYLIIVNGDLKYFKLNRIIIKINFNLLMLI